ncbi:hypothetical protein ARMGADRAFT_1035232 [Armillaria gallica]|uniref:Uncharacterized protein n=1 Tax=Armillaria gallica TaxID=47427 RepID=A0A2H3DFJ8_ARMGA|nr:hypothetical protein ARMGADRAFT_1035232 [Armillaria gallica]
MKTTLASNPRYQHMMPPTAMVLSSSLRDPSRRNSQLDAVTKNIGGSTLGVLFNGGRKLNNVSKPKPWEALNITFIPLLSSNKTFKAYQGLSKTITNDKLAPSFIVIIEMTGDIWDILLHHRVLALSKSLALHIVSANCDELSWAVWPFKANEPIITRSKEEIAKIRVHLCFIILQDLWTDATFHKIIYQAARNHTDPIDRIIFDALVDSFIEYHGVKSTKYWPPPPRSGTAFETIFRRRQSGMATSTSCPRSQGAVTSTAQYANLIPTPPLTVPLQGTTPSSKAQQWCLLEGNRMNNETLDTEIGMVAEEEEVAPDEMEELDTTRRVVDLVTSI